MYLKSEELTHGLEVKFNCLNKPCIGKISIDNKGIKFLCSDEKMLDGFSTENKLGYKYSLMIDGIMDFDKIAEESKLERLSDEENNKIINIEEISHGLSVAFNHSNIKCYGKISIFENDIYLCHNSPYLMGVDVEEKFGYKYSLWIGCVSESDHFKSCASRFMIRKEKESKQKIQRITIKHLRC